MSTHRFALAFLALGAFAFAGCAADEATEDDVTADSTSELNASDSFAIDWQRAVKAIEAKAPSVDVYVPARIPNGVAGDAPGKLYLSTSTHDRDGKQYTINFDFTKDCNGANACTAGGIWSSSTRGFKANGTIAGIPIRYEDMSCGASCSPASISWIANNRMITISLKSTKGDLVGAFRSAVRGGAR